MEKRFNPAKAAPLKETTNGSPFYNDDAINIIPSKKKIYYYSVAIDLLIISSRSMSVAYNLFKVSHVCSKNANNSHIIFTGSY